MRINALDKASLVLLQRKENACKKPLAKLIHFVPAPTACYKQETVYLRIGSTMSVTVLTRSNKFVNFCTIKYEDHV